MSSALGTGQGLCRVADAHLHGGVQPTVWVYQLKCCPHPEIPSQDP